MGKDYPVDALPAPEPYAGPVNRIGLHRQVYLLFRPAFPYQHDQARIGHDQDIGTHGDRGFQVPQVGANLVVVRSYVAGQVKPFALAVGLINGRDQIFLPRLMPDTLAWNIAGGLLMSAIAMVGGVTVFMKPATLERILLPLFSLAATLLGGAFFHMLPEELDSLAPPAWC